MNILKRITYLPLIAISSGDPAGIGPEITVKALNNPDLFDECKPLVVSDARIIQQAVDLCRLQLKINIVKDPSEGVFQYGTIDVLDMKNIDMQDFAYWDYPLTELSGKTLGIIGLGNIGSKVCDTATAFRMNILGTDKKRGDQSTRSNFRWAEINELLTYSDIVSIHAH